MKRFRVTRIIEETYGGEEIMVNANSQQEVYGIVALEPLTHEALKEIHWGVESIEEVKE